MQEIVIRFLKENILLRDCIKSFKAGSCKNYAIKKCVILEETCGDQPLLKAWSGRAGWSGPCLITFWIWRFHSLSRPVSNCSLFFSSEILCLHAFPIWGCSGFAWTCAVPYSAWTCAGEKVPQGLPAARHRFSLLPAPCTGCLQAEGWEMDNVRDAVWPGQGSCCSVRPGLDSCCFFLSRTSPTDVYIFVQFSLKLITLFQTLLCNFLLWMVVILLFIMTCFGQTHCQTIAYLIQKFFSSQLLLSNHWHMSSALLSSGHTIFSACLLQSVSS